MTIYGTDHFCKHGEPAESCGACTDARFLADLDQEQEARRQAEDHAHAVAAVADRMRIRQEAEAALRAGSRPRIPAGLRLDELLSRPLPEMRYRVDRLWPRYGRVVLAAQAKAGKTTVRDNLIRCLVDGGKFLDRFGVEQVDDGTVGLLDTEMGQDILQLWLRDQSICDETRLWVWPLRGAAAALDLLDEQCRRDWAKVLRGRDVKVLVLDCLGPVLAVFGLDESKGVDVGRWLAAFEALLDQAGVDEALVIHHMGHDGERSRGASRLRDWPDAEWKLVRARDNGDDVPDPTRYFAAAGRDVDEPEAALRYDPMDRHLSLTGGSRSMAQAERDLPLVIEWVRQHPDSSSSEIDNAADGIGISRNRCRKARRAALRRGDLCQHPAAKSRENHRVKAECAECAEVRRGELADSLE